MSYDFFIAPDFHWKCHGSSFNLMFVFFCTYSQTFSYMKVNVSVPSEKTVSCIVHRLFWSQSGLQYNKRLISFKRKERSLNKQVPLFIPAEVFHEDFQLVLEDRWVVFVLYGRSGMGHVFGTHAKFSKKLPSLTLEMLVFRKILHTR